MNNGGSYPAWFNDMASYGPSWAIKEAEKYCYKKVLAEKQAKKYKAQRDELFHVLIKAKEIAFSEDFLGNDKVTGYVCTGKIRAICDLLKEI